MLYLFPLIILFGEHSSVGTRTTRLCTFSGRLSYPLYRPHIAFLDVLACYAWTLYTDSSYHLRVFVVLPLVIAIASFVLKLFDESVRAWLTNRYSIKRTKSNVAPSDRLQRAIVC